MKLLSLQKGLRRGNVESSISPYTKTIGLFGIARIELHLAFRDCRPQWNFLRICDALAERFRSEPLDSNRSGNGKSASVDLSDVLSSLGVAASYVSLRIRWKDFVIHLLAESIAGKVGLWTKADSVTYFDDLKVIGK